MVSNSVLQTRLIVLDEMPVEYVTSVEATCNLIRMELKRISSLYTGILDKMQSFAASFPEYENISSKKLNGSITFLIRVSVAEFHYGIEATVKLDPEDGKFSLLRTITVRISNNGQEYICKHTLTN